MLHVLPSPALAPYVEVLWYSDERGGSAGVLPARERALPTGSASLVLRLSEEPVRVFAGLADERAEAFGHEVLGGASSSYYVRDTAAPSISVGAQFRPGGAAAWLGVPADELAERHTPLEQLLGRWARDLRERLLATPAPHQRLACFEAELAARARRARPLHPAVLAALEALGECRGPAAVDEAWRASGYSQRHFIALFRREVGLTPKVFARIRRFQGTALRAARAGRPTWTELAHDGGYSDQSHLVREFQAFAGLAPSAYRPRSGRPNHVPVLA